MRLRADIKKSARDFFFSMALDVAALRREPFPTIISVSGESIFLLLSSETVDYREYLSDGCLPSRWTTHQREYRAEDAASPQPPFTS